MASGETPSWPILTAGGLGSSPFDHPGAVDALSELSQNPLSELGAKLATKAKPGEIVAVELAFQNGGLSCLLSLSSKTAHVR